MSESSSAVPSSGGTQLELRRLPDERNAYQLGDVGIVRRHRTGWRSAGAQAGDRRWTFAASGVWKSRMRAIDHTDDVVGEYLPRAFRGGGTMHWYGRELALRQTRIWRQRYVLNDHGRDILIVDAGTRRRRPVTMTVLDPQLADAGLLLFTAVLAAWSASEAVSTAAGGVAATSVTWMG
jgi:hypothetical protein